MSVWSIAPMSGAVIMCVIRAASVDANRILVDEERSILAASLSLFDDFLGLVDKNWLFFVIFCNII